MKDLAQTFLAGAVGALTVGVLIAATGPLGLRDDGIQFPDGTLQTTAAVQDPRPAFYLTTGRVSGASADTACAGDFHMASLWEILDVSNLRYDTARGQTAGDSGSGPPSGGAIDVDLEGIGWVRTGAKADVAEAPGRANCNEWDSSLGSNWGTTALLNENWDGSGFQPAVAWLGPWETLAAVCSTLNRVWCIED